MKSAKISGSSTIPRPASSVVVLILVWFVIGVKLNDDHIRVFAFVRVLPSEVMKRMAGNILESSETLGSYPDMNTVGSSKHKKGIEAAFMQCIKLRGRTHWMK